MIHKTITSAKYQT